MLSYFNTDTQYARLQGNPLYQALKRHLKKEMVKNDENGKKKTYFVLV